MKYGMSHIAIAVENIESAKSFFEMITGNEVAEKHTVDDQKVNTAFIPIGDTNIELLEPTSDDSPISNFLTNRGGGIHHICIETDEFDALHREILASGVRALGEPTIGAKGRRVVFFHPKDCFNILLELEEILK